MATSGWPVLPRTCSRCSTRSVSTRSRWSATTGAPSLHTSSARATRIGSAASSASPFRTRAASASCRKIVREQQTAAYAWLLAYARDGPELAADPGWLTQIAQVWSPGLRRDDWDDVLALMARPGVAAAVCRWYRCELDTTTRSGMCSSRPRWCTARRTAASVRPPTSGRTSASPPACSESRCPIWATGRISKHQGRCFPSSSQGWAWTGS